MVDGTGEEGRERGAARRAGRGWLRGVSRRSWSEVGTRVEIQVQEIFIDDLPCKLCTSPST
eukprot:scaffold33557_cov27-Tisochrysis_lutea.AAC.3